LASGRGVVEGDQLALERALEGEDLAGRARPRRLVVARFDEELAALYQASLAAFAGNLYYAPIDFAGFRALYQRARPLIDPEFVLLAHDAEGRLVAFQFAFPDPLSVEAGRPTRIVVKTVATVPEARGLGLGNSLLDRIRARALERGYRAVIHALMHVTNFSMSMSARHGTELFRRYALYAWSP